MKNDDLRKYSTGPGAGASESCPLTVPGSASGDEDDGGRTVGDDSKKPSEGQLPEGFFCGGDGGTRTPGLHDVNVTI